MTEKRYEEIWEHGKIMGTKDTKNHVSMNIKTMIRELNSQDERIKELEIGENEIILKQETTINKLLNENERLKYISGIHRSALLDSEYDIKRLEEENEQLKQQLNEVKTNEKQLSISFMEYKMQLIEVLQKHYDKCKGQTLYADVYTEIAEEMRVDLND